MRRKRARAKIGYIPIENFKTDRPKVCEAPLHEGRELAAYAVMAVDGGGYEDFVQMVCYECWKHFDDDMGNPNWNLMEEK